MFETGFQFVPIPCVLRSGENDVEYSGNLEMEEGELPEDAAGATGNCQA